jgi:predicted adenylyl cyclase CyaB
VPIEIEAKLSVPDHEQVRARLRDLGAQPVGSCLETNTFFDTEDRSLLAADEGLRLRKREDDETKRNTFSVTYKGPRRHGQLKSRDEVEMNVGSDRDAAMLFSRLGFLRVLSFEKRRESWKFGGCSIELDTLPHLGTFVEIEGPSEPMVLQVREQLQLSDRPLVKNSYIALLMTHLQDRGDTSRTVTFE